MQPTRRAFSAGLAGAFLLLVGILCAVGYRVGASGEPHSYGSSGVPPATAEVTGYRSYFLSVPGGVTALQRAGVDPGQLQCLWSTPGSGAQLLAVVPLGAATKATDAIATFLAPYSGPIAVTCTGWGPVFIDGADNASTDYAGVLLLLCVIAFTVGVPLALAGLRSRRRGTPGAAEQAEIDELVHAVHVRADDTAEETGDTATGEE